jgi:hypothetical protein
MRSTGARTEDDALLVVDRIFADIVNVLKQTPQFQNTPRDQIDLLLADCRNRVEWEIDGTIQVKTATVDIVEGFAS